MASTNPTEAEYTAAMERHGTPEWTADDQRVMDRWLAHRTGKAAQTPAEGPHEAAEKKGR